MAKYDKGQKGKIKLGAVSANVEVVSDGGYLNGLSVKLLKSFKKFKKGEVIVVDWNDFTAS